MKFSTWIVTFVVTVALFIANTIIFSVTDNDNIKQLILLMINPLLGMFIIFLIGIGLFPKE